MSWFGTRATVPANLRRHAWPVLLLLFGCTLIGVGGYLLYGRLTATTGTAALPTASTISTSDTATAAEKTPPQDTTAYTVPADQPRRIIIPSIGVDGLVEQVGVAPSGALGVPSNIHYAGWYHKSASPGSKGLSVIDGHVSGRYRTAIFSKLRQLEQGELVRIELGDATTKTFQVVEKLTVPAAAAADTLFKERADIHAQLNLITCGGTFNPATQSFPDRVIVVAKLVE